jgi:hypothetical protein
VAHEKQEKDKHFLCLVQKRKKEKSLGQVKQIRRKQSVRCAS